MMNVHFNHYREVFTLRDVLETWSIDILSTGTLTGDSDGWSVTESERFEMHTINPMTPNGPLIHLDATRVFR